MSTMPFASWRVFPSLESPGKGQPKTFYGLARLRYSGFDMPSLSCIRLVGLILAGISLLGCSPVRDNVGDGDGGVTEDAWFVSRPGYGGGSPVWALLYIPRDEDHDCQSLFNYDWSDVDGDFARIELSLADGLDWEGDFANNAESDSCGDWFDPERRCFGGYDYRPELAPHLYTAAATLEVRSYSDETVSGRLEPEDGDTFSFRATNCGEMEYYAIIGESDPVPQSRGTRRGAPKRADW
ncbi:MAG: hypothetical protein VX498_08310, partial [Myxococcota bacterium]|nr:hypothetical protein [Myxococcota bacterium]